jgi:hypothetical protein
MIGHDYLSTACYHGRHGHCQAKFLFWRLRSKTPARCKFCPAPCTCLCHVKERK